MKPQIEEINSMLEKVLGGQSNNGLFGIDAETQDKSYCTETCNDNCGNSVGDVTGTKKGSKFPDLPTIPSIG